MGFLLQKRMSWLHALSKGSVVLGAGAVSWLSARLRWAAALVGCWRRWRCCQLAKRTSAGVSWLCALWRCRKLAAQAAYILVPASRMSTGRGILPSYLGLCWCNFVVDFFNSELKKAMHLAFIRSNANCQFKN